MLGVHAVEQLNQASGAKDRCRKAAHIAKRCVPRDERIDARGLCQVHDEVVLGVGCSLAALLRITDDIG